MTIVAKFLARSFFKKTAVPFRGTDLLRAARAFIHENGGLYLGFIWVGILPEMLLEQFQ
jgi:hypothetical protein